MPSIKKKNILIYGKGDDHGKDSIKVLQTLVEKTFLYDKRNTLLAG